MSDRTIILMGLRGSGKSTLGRQLAQRLGASFADLDDTTAAHMGASDAGAAIRAHGIKAFRDAESAALLRTLDDAPGVLSLGGGTPTAPGAAEALRESARAGTVLVYLHAPPTVLADRIRTDPSDRPSLTGADPGADPGAEFAAVYLARDPLYRELAGAIIEVEHATPGELVEQIAELARS